jgi:hypothetical protein
MHPAENMLALKNTHVVLVLGIVACSASSSRAPFPLEGDSVKVPPFSDSNSKATPPPSEEPPDENVTTPPDDKQAAPAPPPECPTEQEPNNDADQATEFTKCITGELTSWTDNDYLKIAAPKDATNMIVDHLDPDGTIQYAVSIPKGGGGAGGTNNFSMSFTDKAPQTKIKGGQTYLFSLKWDNNGQGAVSDKRTYALRVTFE